MKKNRLTTLTGYVFLTLSFLIPTTNASDSITALTHLWQNPAQIESPCPGDYYSEVIDFYCAAQAYLDYEKLQAISGLPVFIQGPHSKALELNNPHSFGHYDKDFVKWLRENVIPAAQTPAFRELFKFFYLNHVKQPARTYYAVHERLFANQEYLAKEQLTYVRLLKTEGISRGYGYEYAHFAGLKEQGFDGTMVKEAVLFWIRRVTDGTEQEFFLGLKTLLEIYDADFLADLAKQGECQSKDAAKQLECQRLASEKEMLEAKIELEMVYRKLYAKRDAQGQKKLEKAQQAWLQFRENHADFLVYSVDEQTKAMARNDIKAQMTLERIKVLESELEH